MGSKRFKGKPCIYCGVRPSDAGDHIFAREFFIDVQRDNLPQVPACDRCNQSKSKLEHYLTTVLPFGGRHPEAHDNLTTLVPGRLAKNLRLARELQQKSGHTWHVENHVTRRTLTVPIDGEKASELFSLVGQALAWHHFDVLLKAEQTSQALFLSRLGQQFFDRLFTMNAARRVVEDLGNGTVHYRGVQATDAPDLTLWRIKFYGGMALAGDRNSPDALSTEVGVITGKKRLVRMLADER